MNAQIGTLVREGKEIFYAFVGADRNYVEGSLEQVEVALGLREEVKVEEQKEITKVKEAKKGLFEFSVHVQKKYPAGDEIDGFDIIVWAKNKSEANKIARDQVKREIHISEGPVYYTATKKD